MRVAVRRFHFDDAFADFENRNVVRAAAKVEHGDRLILFLVEAVGERRRSRLVNDAHHFEARDLARVFRCLPLRVIEVSGNGDDRLLYFLAKIILGRLLHLLKNHDRDFRRAPFFATRANANVTARSGTLNFVRDLLFLF